MGKKWSQWGCSREEEEQRRYNVCVCVCVCMCVITIPAALWYLAILNKAGK